MSLIREAWATHWRLPPGVTDAEAVAIGKATCARLRSGKGISDAVRVATGARHACAVSAAGKVQCWGWNLHGALARHELAESHTSVAVQGL